MKQTSLRFQVTQFAMFGDEENNRESLRGRFYVNKTEFMSCEPISRRDAREINEAMQALRREMGK